MDSIELKAFQELLATRRKELLAEAQRSLGGMTTTKDNFPDPTDRASLESDRNFMLRIKDRERKLVTKVKEALDRIEDGSFGVCESCGRPISEKRLMVRPVTTQCIECKTDEEQRERGVKQRKVKLKRSFPS